MGRGTFQETYAQDMAIFHTPSQWGALIAFLALLLVCPVFAERPGAHHRYHDRHRYHKRARAQHTHGILRSDIHGPRRLHGGGGLCVRDPHCKARLAVLVRASVRRPCRRYGGPCFWLALSENPRVLPYHGHSGCPFHHHLDHPPTSEYHRGSGWHGRAQAADRQSCHRLQSAILLSRHGGRLSCHVHSCQHNQDKGRQGVRRHQG